MHDRLATGPNWRDGTAMVPSANESGLRMATAHRLPRYHCAATASQS